MTRIEGSNTTVKAILEGGWGVAFFNEEEKVRIRQLNWPVGKTNEFNCIFRLPDKGGAEGFNLAPYTSWLPSDVGSFLLYRLSIARNGVNYSNCLLFSSFILLCKQPQTHDW